MTVTNALNRSLRSHDIETAATSDRDFADMNALFLSLRHNSFDEIASSETFDRSGRFRRCARKAELVHPAHLPRIMTHSLDAQRLDLRCLDLYGSAFPDACRIDPMLFGQSPLRAIEFRQSARAGFDRQPDALETIEERPPRGVDDGLAPSIFNGWEACRRSQEYSSRPPTGPGDSILPRIAFQVLLS